MAESEGMYCSLYSALVGAIQDRNLLINKSLLSAGGRWIISVLFKKNRKRYFFRFLYQDSETTLLIQKRYMLFYHDVFRFSVGKNDDATEIARIAVETMFSERV